MSAADAFALAKIRGRISRKLEPTPGGLLVMSVEVWRETKTGGLKIYIPIKWFGNAAREIAQQYKYDDEVIVDAELSMQSRLPTKCYKCKTEITHCPNCHNAVDVTKFYDVQITGKQIRPDDITGAPSDDGITF